MIDASLGFDIITTNYFSSIYEYDNNDLTVYGTECSEISSWRDWFLPATDDTRFSVALNCQECQSATDKDNSDLEENVAYYHTRGYMCPSENSENYCQIVQFIVQFVMIILECVVLVVDVDKKVIHQAIDVIVIHYN